MKKQLLWGRSVLCVGLAVSSFLLFSACDEKDAATGAEGSHAAATSTAAANKDTKALKGIAIEDVREGTGDVAKKGDTVSVNYLGTLESNGQKFDSSYDRNEPFKFKLGAGQVIEGWDKGIVGMKEGGKRILTIAPDKAYGSTGYPPVIPANAALRFEVELVDIQ